MNVGKLHTPVAIVGAVAADQSQQYEMLMQARATVSIAFGNLQIELLRELAVHLRAFDTEMDQSIPVEATTDQLEAAVRRALATLDA